MTFETEYKTDNVAVEPVAADKIDGTFRSSTIGEYNAFFYFVLLQRKAFEALRHCFLGLRRCIGPVTVLQGNFRHFDNPIPSNFDPSIHVIHCPLNSS